MFPDVVGLEHAQLILARLLRSGRIPHALLFHGPDGVGKGWMARRIARSLVCATPTADGGACETCLSCRKAEHGNHPDIFTVTRLSKKDTRADAPEAGDEDDAVEAPPAKGGELRPFIVVAQIRELTYHATYAPRESSRRVFIVDPADRMNAESQNALLKTLEEPGGRCVIVLVASRPHLLLPTVRSRCFQIGFGAMRPEDLARALVASGMPEPEARARAALSSGRPGHAMTLDLAALESRRDLILNALESLTASRRGVGELQAFADRLMGETESELLSGLELTLALLRDAARIASGAPRILHTDLAPRIEAIARRVGAERLAALAALTDRLQGELRLNVNKTLLVETLLAAVSGGPIPSAASAT